jgi:hypothetical protein
MQDNVRSEVRVHIDQRPHHSPNPTTGAALYRLGSVQSDFELLKEVEGDREDTPVANDATPVHLKEDDHFHSAEMRRKEFRIIVNAELKEVTQSVLTFDEVVALAFPDARKGPNVVFTVTYKKAAKPPHEGSLIEGQSVAIKNGTIFNVTKTDKS